MANSAVRTLGRPLHRTGYRLVYRGFTDAPLEARAEGRFNCQDERRTAYLPLTRRTAALEVAKRWGSVGANRSAYVEFEIPFRLRRIVDLTDPDTATALGVSRETLTGSDLRECQALAGRLRAEGIEGILTWSSADPEEKNLVIFLDQLDPASSIGPPLRLDSSEEVAEL